MSLLRTLPGLDQAASKVAAIFATRVDQGRTPGCRFAVFDEAGILFDGGFGSATLGGPAPDRQTRFRIASCTKSFTVAALLLLRDAGRLSLDEPITRFVPALRPTLPPAAPVAPSVRMLMTMAGGLPTDDPWADRQESLSPAALRAVLQPGVRFATVPGSRFEYSNLGYALLGQVVEQISGQPYPAFVAEALLRPLGLAATTFDFTTVPPARMATGYRRADGAWLALPLTGPGAFSSIGGAISTVPDLVRWASWLAAAFHPDAADGGPLSAASRREMQRIHCPIPPDPGEEYRMKGYGFGLIAEIAPRRGLTVNHSGGYPGFSSHMRWNPEARIGVVAFENATYSGVRDPATAALAQLLDVCAAPLAAGTLPAEVQTLGHNITTLVTAWDDALADSTFLENMTLDLPYTERAAELVELRAQAGAPSSAPAKIRPADGALFGRFEVRIQCSAGTIVAAASLGPCDPPRLQTLSFKVERA
jgi:CubicO group peptidase (beta-lactamase class C family)